MVIIRETGIVTVKIHLNSISLMKIRQMNLWSKFNYVQALIYMYLVYA